MNDEFGQPRGVFGEFGGSRNEFGEVFDEFGKPLKVFAGRATSSDSRAAFSRLAQRVWEAAPRFGLTFETARCVRARTAT